MTLLAQHGHAKSDKLEEALSAGSIAGAIFSARNERKENLVQYLEQMRASGSPLVLFDPQFFVSTLIPPNDRYLLDYDYYEPGRTAADFARARNVNRYVEAVFRAEMTLAVDRLISPSVIVRSFDSRWAQVALNLADASLDRAESIDGAPPLLLSFLISEQAFDSKDGVDEFLDQITSWDAHGVYLVIVRDERTYTQRFDEQRLENLLYTVYVLGHLNGFEIVVGYSDFIGLLLRGVGADFFATGWYHSLRRFHQSSFMKRKGGGRRAADRYSSGPLLNSILLDEVEQIHDVGMLTRVLSGVALDDVVTSAASPRSSDWSARTSELHHWETLKALDAQLTDRPSDNLDRITGWIDHARSLSVFLEGAGVVFDRNTTSQHLREWMRAIESLRRRIGI